jgi:Eco57I restriction-modification methylase
LPLFSTADSAPVLEHAVRTRLRLARQPDDSPSIVAEKAETLAELHAATSALGRWSAMLDLWCAGWFWEDGLPPSTAVFGELCDRLQQRPATLSDRATQRFLDHAAALASQHRFLHWTLAFPEIFCDEQGDPLPAPGFDAVVGNPPWDMLRGDSGEQDVRAGRRLQARRFGDFIREAGVYRLETRSHVNRYQLFVERTLQLTRAGGRLGLVLPSGVAADAGAAPLRRHLLDHAEVDSVTGLHNRGGLFAIHRSLRFVLLTATAGRPTSSIACRFKLAQADDLDRAGPSIIVTRPLLARLSGVDDLGIPEIASEDDLRILETISARAPWLSASVGWNVRFGRELNASDDRAALRTYTGNPLARPVLEGKQLTPFRVALADCRYELADIRNTIRVPQRARIAYRDVASATNRLTLIAAVIPARAVTTHTLFCLKTALPSDMQHVLCGLLNSFVANYLMRLRVNTHVTAALMSRLPVPVVDARHSLFPHLARLSRAMAVSGEHIESMDEYGELQALVARLYGLAEADFEHILATFPLIPSAVKENALGKFRDGH